MKLEQVQEAAKLITQRDNLVSLLNVDLSDMKITVKGGLVADVLSSTISHINDVCSSAIKDSITKTISDIDQQISALGVDDAGDFNVGKAA